MINSDLSYFQKIRSYILLYNVNGKFLLIMARTCQRFVTYTLDLRLRMAAIWSQHFNRGTNCPPLGFQFWVTSKHLLYVITRIHGICQDLHYIRYREIVLLLFCIPYDANFLALKELYSEILVHDDTILCEFGCKVTKYSSRRF